MICSDQENQYYEFDREKETNQRGKARQIDRRPSSGVKDEPRKRANQHSKENVYLLGRHVPFIMKGAVRIPQ